MVMPRWRSLQMRCLTPAILLNIRYKPRAEVGVTVFQIGTAYEEKRKKEEKLVFFFGWLAFVSVPEDLW